MKPGFLLFQCGALVAFLLLVRFTWRTMGPKHAIGFLLYLLVASVFHELAVAGMAAIANRPPNYTAAQGTLRIGSLGVAIVVGWMFATILSFQLARMIQARSFPGSNIFATLTLMALVTSAISYAVEITGMRVGLWVWAHNQPLSVWLPFSYPTAAFRAWPASTTLMMGLFCTFRYRLFSSSRWVSSLVGLAFFFTYTFLEMIEDRLLPAGLLLIDAQSQRPIVLWGCLLALTLWAPKSMLGSSERA